MPVLIAPTHAFDEAELPKVNVPESAQVEPFTNCHQRRRIGRLLQEVRIARIMAVDYKRLVASDPSGEGLYNGHRTWHVGTFWKGSGIHDGRIHVLLEGSKTSIVFLIAEY